jgi:hypothetical protein
VAAAKAMFTDCEAWRKSFGVDELKRSFDFKEKPQISKFYPQYYHKTDKDGRPVYIEQLGAIDLKKMYEISTHERMLQNLVVEYEKFTDNRLPACSRMKGELVETSCTIMDLKGVGVTSISSVYSYVKSASAIGQNYYPERMYVPHVNETLLTKGGNSTSSTHLGAFRPHLVSSKAGSTK